MTIMSIVWALLLLVQTVVVQGSCYVDYAYRDEKTGNPFCMLDNTTRIEENTWYLTPDCFNCSCGRGWMSCCGVGFQAGVFRIPKGFRMQLVPPCDFIIVPE
ncbi:hypothetical protein C0Q70_17462 [Pomacea canaliculata]|uniref:Single domain-containing protein n=1 Tax=Pomacea canaliculata TaxID=400727 RepID=A0A2T7NKH0_POMCA|nr:uncharacterized protein LOC112575352 [Pomacea canaliculata]PVD21663.1 hypothetical protein C0Q70_17462 [Pomacea canaliculata]